jgi:hypothetical protein
VRRPQCGPRDGLGLDNRRREDGRTARACVTDEPPGSTSSAGVGPTAPVGLPQRRARRESRARSAASAGSITTTAGFGDAGGLFVPKPTSDVGCLGCGCPSWETLSIGVRWRPLLTTTVITHWLLVCLGALSASSRSCSRSRRAAISARREYLRSTAPGPSKLSAPPLITPTPTLALVLSLAAARRAVLHS